MVAARSVWTIETAWVICYGVLWVWLLTLAVRLVTGRDVPARTTRTTAGTPVA